LRNKLKTKPLRNQSAKKPPEAILEAFFISAVHCTRFADVQKSWSYSVSHGCQTQRAPSKKAFRYRFIKKTKLVFHVLAVWVLEK
jgi:hypothetical protein